MTTYDDRESDKDDTGTSDGQEGRKGKDKEVNEKEKITKKEDNEKEKNEKENGSEDNENEKAGQKDGTGLRKDEETTRLQTIFLYGFTELSIIYE